MKQLTQKQKDTLAAKANETRIIGDYKGLWLYVEELLNGEPNAPVKPVPPAVVIPPPAPKIVSYGPTETGPERRIKQFPINHPERRLIAFTYPAIH